MPETTWDNLKPWFAFYEAKAPVEWRALQPFMDIFKKLNAQDILSIKSRLNTFDAIFHSAFNDKRVSDPTYTNWEDFRPLRLNREEGYSYWLAHLIESSESGVFGQLLLGGDASSHKRPKVRTEVTGNDRYRADVVIFRDKLAPPIHIEVKIGDPNLSKTYETGLDLETTFSIKFDHFILLADWQLSEWESTANNAPAENSISISSLTWSDVAFALRRVFVKYPENENAIWKSTAWSFIGAIEQNLIQFRGALLNTVEERQLASCGPKLEILERSLE